MKVKVLGLSFSGLKKLPDHDLSVAMGYSSSAGRDETLQLIRYIFTCMLDVTFQFVVFYLRIQGSDGTRRVHV